MGLLLSSLVERLRASLFFLPTSAVFLAVVIGAITLFVDSRFEAGTELPLGFTSTVESARALLGTIAGATISFAGVAFSVSLLVIQLASSQYSPRVIHTMFRDPFNRRVMALVVGTFTYCVIILRSVRSPLDEDGQAIIPNLSVAVAVVLGIVAVLAVIAFIDHNAHAMDVSEILERVGDEARAQIAVQWAVPESSDIPMTPRRRLASVASVRFDRSGWVQQVDVDAIERHAPDGIDVIVHTFAGRYAIEGAVLCTLSGEPDDLDETSQGIRRAIAIGPTRTMQEDVSYGLRQLVDVGLRALSSGVNDPTTAQDAIFHLTAVVADLLRRNPPPPVRERPSGGSLVLARQPDHVELVQLAYDEIRQAAASQPTVCIYLLESLSLLGEAAGTRSPVPAADAIAAQARLVVEGCEAAGLLPDDVARVRDAHDAGFG